MPSKAIALGRDNAELARSEVKCLGMYNSSFEMDQNTNLDNRKLQGLLKMSVQSLALL